MTSGACGYAGRCGVAEPRNRGQRVITAAEVESEIMRLSDVMEEVTGSLVDLAQAAAEADVAYRAAKAKINLRATLMAGSGKGGRTTVDERESIVDDRCHDEMLAQRTTEAMYEVARERLRTMRSQIDALRTISANIRSQT